MILLSLEPSRAIHALIGEYETEHRHGHVRDIGVSFPAPTFAELIRVLPRIGEKKEWLQGVDQFGDGRGDASIYINSVLLKLSLLYMLAPTEKQGMHEVENYLMELLK